MIPGGGGEGRSLSSAAVWLRVDASNSCEQELPPIDSSVRLCAGAGALLCVVFACVELYITKLHFNLIKQKKLVHDQSHALEHIVHGCKLILQVIKLFQGFEGHSRKKGMVREDFKRNPEIEAFSRFLRRLSSTRARAFGRTLLLQLHSHATHDTVYGGSLSAAA